MTFDLSEIKKTIYTSTARKEIHLELETIR